MVKKGIPDAEEFVFTGNFECVSMSRKVMRTAANTNTHATSFYIIKAFPMHNTWLRLYHTVFLDSVVIVFFILTCTQCSLYEMTARFSSSPDFLPWICFVLGSLPAVRVPLGVMTGIFAFQGHFLFWFRLHICYRWDRTALANLLPFSRS